MPNGFAAIKEKVDELGDWTEAHTKEFNKFVLSSEKKDAIHTEQIKTLKERIEDISANN